MGLELGPDRHFAGEDFTANIVGDLLVERS
jgi:hypothetical protein